MFSTLQYSAATLALIASIGLGAGAVTAAGDDDGHHHGGDMRMAGVPGHADEATRSIEIAMHDNYYEPETIDAKAGETILFVITNHGSVVHEFNIGTAAMHTAHQEEMAMMVDHGVIEIDRINHDMMDKDMGGGHVMSHDDPNSALLAPGESAEVIWKFTEARPLEFACNIPGHYESGMMGDITVTP